MRKLGALLLLVVGALALGGCTLYQSALGTANLDGVAVKFTLNSAESQLLDDVYNGICGDYFACYKNLVLANTDDPIGRAAFADCGTGPPPWSMYGCPYGDEIGALYGRISSNPGGFPSSTEWTTRCLAFNLDPLNAGLLANLPNWNESEVSFIVGTWSWVPHGSWSCA